MKKILILTMSCNDEFFNNQIKDIQNTWASNLPENIEWLYYTGDLYSKQGLKGNHLSVNSEDDLPNTFKKTIQAINFALTTREFDYLVRTNTSTYINTKLLNYFCNNINDDSVVYGSELYSLTEGYAPTPLNIYARGNCMIMSRKICELLTLNAFPFLYLEKVDDMMIGNILNSSYMMRGEDYLNHIKGLTHGWFKCTPNLINCGHKLCEYGHSTGGIDFYKNCISVQIKNYVDRKLETERYNELHSYFKNWNPTTEELQDIYSKVIEYSNDPSIFIGSILGYISLKEWKETDKAKLFWIEFSNKACDDAEHQKYLDYCKRFNIH